MGMPLTDHDYEQLNAYLDGMLTPAERAAFEQRLAQDTALQAEFESLRATIALLGMAERIPVPRSFTLDPAVYARHQKTTLWQRINLPRLTPFVAAGAVAVITLLCVGVFLLNGGLGGGGATSVAEVQEAAPAAEMPVEEQAAGADAFDAEGMVAEAETEMVEEAAEEPAPEEPAALEEEEMAGEPAEEEPVEEEPSEEAEAPAAEAAPPMTEEPGGYGGGGEGDQAPPPEPTMTAAPSGTPLEEPKEAEEDTAGESTDRAGGEAENLAQATAGAGLAPTPTATQPGRGVQPPRLFSMPVAIISGLAVLVILLGLLLLFVTSRRKR